MIPDRDTRWLMSWGFGQPFKVAHIGGKKRNKKRAKMAKASRKQNRNKK